MLVRLEQYHTDNLPRINERFNLMFNKDRPNAFSSLIRKRGITRRKAELLQVIYDQANEMYPGNVDLQVQFKISSTPHTNQYGGGSNREDTFEVFTGYKLENKVNLMIRFPEVLIHNGGSNQGHIIRDLIVTHPITINQSYVPNFKSLLGLRVTKTVMEDAVSYAHSHLLTKRMRGVDNIVSRRTPVTFCTGGAEGEISHSMAMLNDEFNADTYGLHLNQIAAYVSWESIEGGPYIRYSTVRQGVSTPQDNTNIEVSNGDMRSFANYVKQYCRDISLNWDLGDVNNPKLIDDESIDDMFKNTSFIWDNFRNSGCYFVFRREDGTYFHRLNNNTIGPPVEYEDYIVFKNEKLHFKLINPYNVGTTETLERSKENLFINPNIKQYVIARLEAAAKKAFFRESITRRYNQSRRIRTSPQSNQVPMS